jgi:peroxiredoxin
MNLVRHFLTLGIFLILAARSARAEEADTSLVKVGDRVPAFTVTTTDGARFSMEDQKGKVVLVTFFATWCVPCMQEMPHLETDVWQKFKDRGLVLVAIGREHQIPELRKFKADRLFTMPIAADPDRAVFAKFAKEFIPRAFLVGADGKVAFASQGYDMDEFPALGRAVAAELAKAGKAESRQPKE